MIEVIYIDAYAYFIISLCSRIALLDWRLFILIGCPVSLDSNFHPAWTLILWCPLIISVFTVSVVF